ncbi:MAG: acyltransferase [Oscillospiraceae bacterium]|nr:acyltransferase [Oscillospiraceae bacterium]
MENRNRDYALDLLRFICAILITLTHYEGMFHLEFSGIRFNGGTFYVGLVNEMFFLLSGYLSFHAIEKIENGLSFDKYFSSKVLRLVPLGAISTVFYAALARWAWPENDFSVWQVIITSLGANAGGAFRELFVNSHLWYTSVLLICYAFFFIGIRLSQRLKINWRYACFFMIVVGASAYARFDTVPFLRHEACRGYMAFFTGVLLSSALSRQKPGKLAGIISGSVIAVLTALIAFRYEIMDYGMNYMMIFIYFPALIVLIEMPLIHCLLNRKCFRILGEIAFDIYVWHFEFNMLADIANSLLHLGINFESRWTEVIMVLINIVIGFASYYILERPLNRFIKKKTARVPAGTAGASET